MENSKYVSVRWPKNYKPAEVINLGKYGIVRCNRYLKSEREFNKDLKKGRK